MGKGKEDVDENLGGLLSRLTDLVSHIPIFFFLLVSHMDF